MSKILYLIEQPLDERNFDRFGIQTWIEKGWTVEVWDLTPLSYPDVWQKAIDSGLELKQFGDYFPVTSRHDLRVRYAHLDENRYFLDLTGDNFYSLLVKRRLKKMGVRRAVFATGSIPGIASTPSSLGAKLKKAFLKGPARTFEILVGILLGRYAARFVRPELVIVSGFTSLPSEPEQCEIVKAHNLDYDIYLKLNASNVSRTEDGVVFIDQDYCFHPEYIYQNTPCLVKPEDYFPAICRGLRKVSDVLVANPKIAGYPRSLHQENHFDGIPVEYGRTAEMIKNCSAVVSHDSTAIQFAVLFEKPVVFVTTDQLDSTYFDCSFKRDSIARFAAELGKTVINLDRDLDLVDWTNALAVDPKKYAAYRNKYIKIDGSAEKSSWEIVIDHVSRASRVDAAPVGRYANGERPT